MTKKTTKTDSFNTIPFLRWAGGKRWLLKHMNSILNDVAYDNYHEPFLGGGSIFFFLPKAQNSYLSDLNPELINTYIQVRDNVNNVIEYLSEFINTKEFYYKIRSEVFKEDSKRAAQFIFLNQTSFNGIYRVNLKGQYNVPYGFRKKNFLQKENLISASNKLKGVELSSGQFDTQIDKIKKGDLVFLDPPYTITHNNNGFIKYNEKIFSLEDQKRLSEFIMAIKEIGAYYLLTNAAHSEVKKIFSVDKPLKFSRASLIGGKKAKRGHYEEFVFTNLNTI